MIIKTIKQPLVFLVLAIMLFATIMSIVVFGNSHEVAYAATDDIVSSLDNDYTVVRSNENAGSFGDVTPTPRWFTYQPRLGWTTNKNYSSLAFSDKEVTYHIGSGVHAFGGYINEECYSVTGTDASGEVYRLEPVNGLDQPNNINANGNTTIQFSYIQDPRGTCVWYNNTSRLNSLTSGFYVDNSTQVGTGKILYRSTNGTYFGSWSVADLNGSAALSFTEDNVQIAVIYELNEKGRFMLDRDIHYYIAGIYRFNIE